MKKTILLATLISCSGIYAQEDKAIAQWQSAHPTTLLISTTHYASLSDDEKALIGEDYILFEGKVTLQQLQQAELAKGLTSEVELIKEKEAQIIKDWLGTHQEVMIIRQSKYASYDSVRQQYCVDRPLEILILEGEFLTLKDIEHYGL